MLDHLYSLIQHSSSQKILISAAILFHLGIHKICQKVFWVFADQKKIIQRASKRDHMNPIAIKQRLKSQQLIKITTDDVDLVIDNNGSLDDLEIRVKNMIKSLDEF